MKKLLKQILWILAKLTLMRYQPRIVAITGSVGKTSTKQAVALVLKNDFSVRASSGNYNNEIGVPLAIIGEETGGRNPLVWLLVFVSALAKLIHTVYPQVLILELGTDRPGDIRYLADMLGKIEIGIITDIGISHLEFFPNPGEIAKEKLNLIKKLDRTATAVLNFDSPKVFEGRTQTRAEVIGYGFNDQSHIMLSDFQIIEADSVWGVNFKIHYRGTVVPFFLPNVLGKPALLSAAAASAVALRLGLNLSGVSEALKSYVPPPGRLRMINGIKRTLIIDDTYNAAPDSMFAALEVLGRIARGRKIAALGGMAELGNKTESGHREVAAKIVECRIDSLFLVGENAKIIQDELNKRQFSGRVSWFATSDEARIPMQDAMLEHDTILVKGSQSARMEKIVKEIIAEPEKSDELLVRQSKGWLYKS